MAWMTETDPIQRGHLKITWIKDVVDRRRPRVVHLLGPQTSEYVASCGNRTCLCDQLRTWGWEVMLGYWVARRNQRVLVQGRGRQEGQAGRRGGGGSRG